MSAGYFDSPDQARNDKCDVGRGGMGSRFVESVWSETQLGRRALEIEVDGRRGASNKQRMGQWYAGPLRAHWRGRQAICSEWRKG